MIFTLIAPARAASAVPCLLLSGDALFDFSMVQEQTHSLVAGELLLNLSFCGGLRCPGQPRAFLTVREGEACYQAGYDNLTIIEKAEQVMLEAAAGKF